MDGLTLTLQVFAWPETQDNFIFGLVLDSTYGDLTQVVTDMLSEITKSAEKRDLRIPSAMMGAGMSSSLCSRPVLKFPLIYYCIF